MNLKSSSTLAPFFSSSSSASSPQPAPRKRTPAKSAPLSQSSRNHSGMEYHAACPPRRAGNGGDGGREGG